MNYYSTRDTLKKTPVSSAQAIKQGLAEDGGLFVPERIPEIDAGFIGRLSGMSYPQRAKEIMSLFLEDYTAEELEACCNDAYAEESFKGGVAPLHYIDGSLYSMELWHGPTCAFKDVALQIMPRLLSLALEKTGEKRNALVLVATSGDTGKAALEGYKDVNRIKIKVFYPAEGVSKVQKLQMITQSGSNVGVYGIKGNFDDAQSAVKKIFADKDMQADLDKRGWFFSSANSINWGRLLPQVVYYFSAYCDLLADNKINNGDKINFCVPTGNFGDIFAAYIAYKMGLPVNRLICASNSNNVLTDFLATGEYNRNREFRTTISPSMDILISSNLERLLYFTAGPELTCAWMKSLSKEGKYTVDAATLASITSLFSGYYADENSTETAIRDTYEDRNYLIDTHTAVGLFCARRYIADTSDKTLTVVASTANPYKFAGSVYRAITYCKPEADYAALEQLYGLTKSVIPTPLCGLNERKIRFPQVIKTSEIPEAVKEGL